MGTRTLAQIAPTAGEIALNAYIYGYGGHSLVTPHAALKRLWWMDSRIETKVTRAYVVSKLRGEEREFLDRPLAFGEGLTDDTYMEWILERSKRLFLILAEIGVPDQIFGCIDDSWDDADLPVSLEDVETLELSYEPDEKLNKKFYQTQFLYLLRELKHGHHIDYGPKEHIPMEYVNTLPPAVSLQSWDRVHFAGRLDDIFVRRKFALVDKDSGHNQREAFTRDVRKAKLHTHEHIASAWASYTSEDAGYVLSDFVAEHTLRTYIDHRTPMQLLRVVPSERPRMLFEWMHCLADALAFLHRRGVAHTAIRPSNILLNHDNRIAFADIGSLRTFQQDKKTKKAEIYEHAAPESQISRKPITLASSPPISSMGAFSRLRKLSSSTSSSSTPSSGTSSTRSNSFCTNATTPTSSPFMKTGRSNSLTSLTTVMSPLFFSRSASNIRNFSRHLGSPTTPSLTSSVPPSPTASSTPTRVFPHPTQLNPDTLRDLPLALPEMSDIFSLACICLDILTFALRGRTTEFVKFRCSRQTTQSTSPRSRSKSHVDTSFHTADPDKLDAWADILREDAAKRSEEIFRAVPELLALCKQMMAQNATLRPSARAVSERIQSILVGQAGVETLCCARRKWEAPDQRHRPMSPELERESTRDSMMSAAQFSPPWTDGGARLGMGTRKGSGLKEESSIVREPSTPEVPWVRPGSAASSGAVSIERSAWRRAFTRVRTG
ncbi:hypothetical protein B0A48_04486 [Cryoendolithus antarcticus]|uniref:Protein kinase domain-containing protein n=1 Tax=Cryoendolithus antarcticus TaxID=1507870 RepID=A0A1V8TFH1_9PEZI|nr:hypothetical protein B0A48_04486 [Cryoendolithus antarcticus]